MKIENINYHVDALNIKLRHAFQQEKYKFLFIDGWYFGYTKADSNWDKDGFVLIEDDEIIGYVAFSISRPTNQLHINGLALFSENNKHRLFFYKEINKYILKTLSESYYSKITFSVIIGNKIEKAYDRFIKSHNGKIIGIKEKDTVLSDGRFYDLKLYEIINNNFRF